MIELLSRYSINDIIIFIILLALAFKGVFSFFSWMGDFLKQTVHHAEAPQKLAQVIKQQKEEINDLKKCLSQLNDSVHLLIKSDKDAIKAYITREHHYFVYEQKWIDDYSLDCLQKRFVHYQEQGGNTFVLDLMQELRALPKQQPMGKKETTELWQKE